MKTPVILLLTNDSGLEESIAETLSEIGGITVLTRDAAEALQHLRTIGQDVDLAVIDCEHGPHGLTLASAITARRKDFPVIVVTPEGGKYIEALAYANGATVCLSRQMASEQLAQAVKQCIRTQETEAIAA